MNETVASRLEKMGVTLPAPPVPVASYVGFAGHAGLLFVSGQLPLQGGKLVYAGRLGDGVSMDEGIAAARLCAVNILAQVNAALEGDLERVVRCVRLGGFVASTPAFHDQPRVVNGASDFMSEALGERGRHARAAVGVAALPMNACVEVDAIFAVA